MTGHSCSGHVVDGVVDTWLTALSTGDFSSDIPGRSVRVSKICNEARSSYIGGTFGCVDTATRPSIRNAGHYQGQRQYCRWRISTYRSSKVWLLSSF